MAKTTETTAPTFEAIAVDDLPAPATKGASADTIALGQAIIAATGEDHANAAVEPTIHKAKNDAQKRAAALRRAVAAAGQPAGTTTSARILTADGGFRVAILIRPVEAEATADTETPTED